ncbi:PIN domain-containing protein [Archaeoglobales archaeon]|nr:MAG: PIN domain-containing protein [Archaeoglobales archaeon]
MKDEDTENWNNKVVLDSSVIVALFFKEELSDKVEETVEKFSEFHTVSQAYAEVANATWKRVKIYGEDEELSKQALGLALEFIDKICEVEDSRAILDSAYGMAVRYNVTVYDALFISLAMKVDSKLITIDRKLFERVKGTELERFVEYVGC